MFKKILSIVTILSLFIGFSFPDKVNAEPSIYQPTQRSAVATTTVSYMTPGAATTTAVFDSYSDNNYAPDKVGLGIFFTGSSTASTLNMAFEYATGIVGTSAVNCVTNPNSCDWYRDALLVENGRSTTTASMNASLTNTVSLTFASSSVGGAAVAAGNATTTALIRIPVPTRFVRVVFSMALGGTNGAIWSEFIPVRQVVK